MNLEKAKIIYGSLLEEANKARNQLILENSDNFAYNTELSEDVKDEFKAISVLTSVAFRELVHAGLEPTPVKDKPGFMEIEINNQKYMCLGSILQGTLESAITKSALREEADNIGINIPKSQSQEDLIPRSTTTINNNGINAADLAEIVKAAVSAVNPIQMMGNPQLLNNNSQPAITDQESDMVEDIYFYTPSDFQNEFECGQNNIIFEVNQIMYSSHAATMRNFLLLAAPLELYKTAQNHIPIFVYAESDEEITYASAYDNFTSDGRVKITIDDLVLFVTGAFDSHGGFHIKVETEDEFIRLITTDKRTNGNALVSKNGHPKFHLDSINSAEVIPIGIGSDNFVVIQRIGDEIGYIHVGSESGLDSALVVTDDNVYNIEPYWENKKMIVRI